MSDENVPPTPQREDVAGAGQAENTNMRSNSQGRSHRRNARRRSSSSSFSSASNAGGSRSGSEIGSAINMDELRDLVELIAAHGFTDFELESESFRVRLRRETSSSAKSEIGVPNTTAPQPSAESSLQSALPIAVSSTSAPPALEATSTGVAAQSSQSVAEQADDANLHTIVSPIVGTFYRSPSPTSDPFVRVGDTVNESTVVCIVEAMKLMNEIQAETTGVIEKIYLESGQPVEYGQPLFGVRR